MIRYIPQPEGVPEEVLPLTTQFFAWEEDGEQLAVGGEMSKTLLDNDVYLWLVFKRRDLSAKLRLRGMRQVAEYLRGLPGQVLAECVTAGEAENRFLRACGFRCVTEVDGRNVYLWGGK